MAALNRNETEILRNVQAVIEFIQRNGYDPKSKDEQNKHVTKLLKEARSGVNMVTQMKGYYPK